MHINIVTSKPKHNHKGRKLMTVEQLINELKKYPKDMEVRYDYDNYATYEIDNLSIQNGGYNKKNEKVVVIM